MANASRVAELVQDVRDVVGVGSYGLYELSWTLKGEHPGLSEQDKIEDATAAVGQLVQDGGVEVVALRWPSEEIEAVVPLSQLSPSSFGAPSAGAGLPRNDQYGSVIGQPTGSSTVVLRQRE